MTNLDPFRYPSGRFNVPATSLAGIRAAHIETLRQPAKHLRSAVKGLNDPQLDTPLRDPAAALLEDGRIWAEPVTRSANLTVVVCCNSGATNAT
jgi:hypothetical protein